MASPFPFSLFETTNHLLVAMKTTKSIVLLTTILLLNVHAIAFAAHPYHVSLAEIEFNRKTGNFEVAVCLWPADVEKALREREKKPVDLDKSQDLDRMLTTYVESRMSLMIEDKRVSRIRWVGYQTDNKQTWLYFEMIPTQRLADSHHFKIENRLFFELNEDQVNQINIRIDKSTKSFSTRRGSGNIELGTNLFDFPATSK